MATIEAGELPDDALLRRYSNGRAYADCYVTEFAGRGSHAQFVEAFYTSTAFKVERLLLAWFMSCPSTDLQARELASASTSAFAASRTFAR